MVRVEDLRRLVLAPGLEPDQLLVPRREQAILGQQRPDGGSRPRRAQPVQQRVAQRLRAGDGLPQDRDRRVAAEGVQGASLVRGQEPLAQCREHRIGCHDIVREQFADLVVGVAAITPAAVVQPSVSPAATAIAEHQRAGPGATLAERPLVSACADPRFAAAADACLHDVRGAVPAERLPVRGVPDREHHPGADRARFAGERARRADRLGCAREPAFPLSPAAVTDVHPGGGVAGQADRLLGAGEPTRTRGAAHRADIGAGRGPAAGTHRPVRSAHRDQPVVPAADALRGGFGQLVRAGLAEPVTVGAA